jgi:hypothetical protein
MTSDTMIDETELDALGHGRIDSDHLADVISRCLHTTDVAVEQVSVTPVDYRTDTIATEALNRVSGLARDPGGTIREFSIFVKQLRSARLWPLIHLLPEELQREWASTFPWRIEMQAFSSPLVDVMPTGFRMAELYEIVEIDDARATIWMEDVQVDPSRRWTTPDYIRAGRLLGELAGRRPRTGDTCLGELEMYRTPGLTLKMYAGGRIANQTFPAIHSEHTWAMRGLDGDDLRDLRARLRQATTTLDVMLERLDELPQVYAHGDASPQNLLMPVDEPDVFVVIDWGFNSPHAVGFDLGQLLLGLVNNDELSADEVAPLEPRVITAYTGGLHAVGFDATAEQVREGYALSVAIRSMFTALGIDEGPPDEHWSGPRRDNRVAMTRHLLDLHGEYLR